MNRLTYSPGYEKAPIIWAAAWLFSEKCSVINDAAQIFCFSFFDASRACGELLKIINFCKSDLKRRSLQHSLDQILNVVVDAQSESSSSSSFEGHPLQARHKQNWGRGFILLLPQTAVLPGSDAGSDVIKPASSFVIQNRQTACSMWCPMYGAHC